MDNLNAFAELIDPVVDPHWRVQDRADIGPLGRDHTDVRKSAQKVHMVQKGVAEPRSSVAVVARNIVKYFEKIAPGARGNDYFEHDLLWTAPGKLLAEFFQPNSLPTVELRNPFINGAQSGSILSVDQFGNGMVDTRLDHKFSIVNSNASKNSSPPGLYFAGGFQFSSR